MGPAGCTGFLFHCFSRQLCAQMHLEDPPTPSLWILELARSQGEGLWLSVFPLPATLWSVSLSFPPGQGGFWEEFLLSPQAHGPSSLHRALLFS